MKTKQNKTQSKGLLSRPEQLVSEQTKNQNQNSQQQQAEVGVAPAPTPAQPAKQDKVLPYVNFKQRDENRALPTDRVLALLQRWMPRQYQLAEVVGKWVWITFPDQPEDTVRGQLSQFGFHWNNSRKCWQHPCGQFATEGSGQDPRAKYGSRMITSPAA